MSIHEEFGVEFHVKRPPTTSSDHCVELNFGTPFGAIAGPSFWDQNSYFAGGYV
jgi:hypothetical protein